MKFTHKGVVLMKAICRGSIFKGFAVIASFVFLFGSLIYSQTTKFEKVFSKERDFVLKETSDVIISSITDMGVDSKGNIWILDWSTHKLYRFDNQGGSASVIALKGVAPSELYFPQKLYITGDDHVFVVNLAQRLSEYDPNGKFISSFVPSHGHFPNSCVSVSSRGDIIIGGLKKNSGSSKFQGKMIHVYNHDGKYIKSFCDIDEKVERLNLSSHRSISFSLDKDDNIYSVQPVDFKITVFDKNGNLVKKFGEKQSYYKEPIYISDEVQRDQQKLKEAESKITFTMDVLVRDNKVWVTSRNTPGLNGNEFRFFIDVYDLKTSKLIAGGIESDMWPGPIKNGKMYFYKTEEKKDKEDEQTRIFVYKVILK
jgi:hypothetical protein